jgi:hypothetical protein
VFAALNSACVGDVVVVHAPAGAHCHSPVHVLSLCTGAAVGSPLSTATTRLLVLAEAGASLEVKPRPYLNRVNVSGSE